MNNNNNYRDNHNNQHNHPRKKKKKSILTLQVSGSFRRMLNYEKYSAFALMELDEELFQLGRQGETREQAADIIAKRMLSFNWSIPRAHEKARAMRYVTLYFGLAHRLLREKTQAWIRKHQKTTVGWLRPLPPDPPRPPPRDDVPAVPAPHDDDQLDDFID